MRFNIQLTNNTGGAIGFSWPYGLDDLDADGGLTVGTLTANQATIAGSGPTSVQEGTDIECSYWIGSAFDGFAATADSDSAQITWDTTAGSQSYLLAMHMVVSDTGFTTAGGSPTAPITYAGATLNSVWNNNTSNFPTGTGTHHVYIYRYFTTDDPTTGVTISDALGDTAYYIIADGLVANIDLYITPVGPSPLSVASN